MWAEWELRGWGSHHSKGAAGVQPVAVGMWAQYHQLFLFSMNLYKSGKSPTFQCPVTSPNFSVNATLAEWNKPVGPVCLPWNGSSQGSALTHICHFSCLEIAPRIPGWASLGQWYVIYDLGQWGQMLEPVAVPPPQKCSEIGPGPWTQSLVATQELRAFLEIPRNPCSPWPLVGSSDPLDSRWPPNKLW